MNLVAKLRRIFGSPRPVRARPTYTYRQEAKTPSSDEILDGEIVEVVYEGDPIWVLFRCPCKRGHLITLPAAHDRRPRWSLSLDGGLATLFPSVWQREGCFSHFLIESGEVVWCRNSGTPPWVAAPKRYAAPK